MPDTRGEGLVRMQSVRSCRRTAAKRALLCVARSSRSVAALAGAILVAASCGPGRQSLSPRVIAAELLSDEAAIRATCLGLANPDAGDGGPGGSKREEEFTADLVLRTARVEQHPTQYRSVSDHGAGRGHRWQQALQGWRRRVRTPESPHRAHLRRQQRLDRSLVPMTWRR